jgi:p-hydroxybenzoate 3-monooxygenase
VIRYLAAGERHELRCDVIAGCDGFHGITRPSIPAGVLTTYEREYPFAWLGILAQAPPTTDELIYSGHDRGFALYSMRSPELTRLYLQVALDEALDAWPDQRVWDELARRLPTDAGFDLKQGPVLEKLITAMRSFVVDPMRHGRLFLAGDAAHIVPPTGAKGMNLAIADVWVLALGLDQLFRTGREDLLDGYSATCARRVWRVQHFSWWMTSMLHRFDTADAYQRQLQLSELDFVTTSVAASTALAENYVGLPLADPRPGGSRP